MNSALALVVSVLMLAPPVFVAKPGEALRTQYGLTAATWKANYPKILADDPNRMRLHLEQVMYSYVQNPREVRVEIAPTTPAQLLEGFFPRIQFEFRDGLFDSGQVSHLVVDMRNVKLSYEELLLNDRIRFVDQGKVDYLCEVSEEQLNHAIFEQGGKKMNVKNPKIELRNGSIRFSGRVKHGLGSTNVRVDGSMKVVDGTKIFFQPSSMKLSILPMPGFVAREIFSHLNPIADLSRLQMKAAPDLIVSRTDRLFVLTHGMEPLVPKDKP